MPDNNAAIVLILFLVFIVISIGAYFARKWIRSFSIAILQAKQAQKAQNETVVDGQWHFLGAEFGKRIVLTPR
ncbi:hypothetical protein VP1G_10593 [Cytospora mali]|uniref:Uncharacterized protein n=1 Tax=Cytospora mali TaxID=578113 RepID=A0A194UPE3_CYTMA|nr:hypothetical protein VP1G_10593 [Valsa mali var. pyri (nom. inval.)]